MRSDRLDEVVASGFDAIRLGMISWVTSIRHIREMTRYPSEKPRNKTAKNHVCNAFGAGKQTSAHPISLSLVHQQAAPRVTGMS
jgi:hypothetical protein